MLCQFCRKGMIYNIRYVGEYDNLYNYMGDCSNCEEKTTIGTKLKMKQHYLKTTIEEEIALKNEDKTEIKMRLYELVQQEKENIHLERLYRNYCPSEFGYGTYDHCKPNETKNYNHKQCRQCWCQEIN